LNVLILIYRMYNRSEGTAEANMLNARVSSALAADNSISVVTI
jgi:hypothetical protein